MVPVPGIRLEDGSIKRSVGAAGTASVILSNSNNKEAAWEFIQWWTSADSQERFAIGMESLMGTAARQPVANVEAMMRLPWSVTESELLLEQWNHVQEIPEVPGSYYTVRGIDYAFREVVLDWSNPRESLNRWNRAINEELLRKRKEFGIE
jgi:ABC-type glycerol-3-phosphate transport system substrate-binding protein